MKKNLIILIILLCVCALSAQSISLYNKARSYYKSEKYEKAISVFTDLISKYPNDKLVPNAHYWIGECYYDLDDYAKAVKAFQNVADFHFDSEKAPDAVLKIGLCYKKLGLNDQARLELTRLKKTFPDYERMKLVNKFLKELQ